MQEIWELLFCRALISPSMRAAALEARCPQRGSVFGWYCGLSAVSAEPLPSAITNLKAGSSASVECGHASLTHRRSSLMSAKPVHKNAQMHAARESTMACAGICHEAKRLDADFMGAVRANGADSLSPPPESCYGHFGSWPL